jgi:hypothetical protein
MSPRRPGRGARFGGAALLLLLAGCAAKIPVHVDPASRTTLAGYRVYAWMTVPPEVGEPSRETELQTFNRRVRGTAEQALAARGYIRSDSAPEMFVLLRITVDEKYTDSLSAYYHYRDAGGTQPLFNAFSLGYEEAELSVEAFDASSRALLWRGRTAVALDAPRREERASASVAKLLDSFPSQHISRGTDP